MHFWSLPCSYSPCAPNISKGEAQCVQCHVEYLHYYIMVYYPHSVSKKERLVNDNDAEEKDYTEVAVVDNPLYGENEGDVEAYLKEDLATEHEEDETNEVYIIVVLYTG